MGSALSMSGCSGYADDTGDMNPPQESVSDGNLDLSAWVDVKLQAGTGVLGLSAAEVADGWTVEYTSFLVTIGAIEFTRADGSSVLHQENSVIDVLDLKAPVNVHTIAVAPGLSELTFTMPVATSEFLPIKPTSPADRGFMVDNGYAIYVEGTISRADGLTCDSSQPAVCTPAPVVAFAWGLDVGALIEDCPEVEVDREQTAERTLKIAGDRLFHTNFRPVGAAPPVRRAQWLANADSDRDGVVTLDELASTKAAALFDPQLGYDVRSDAPVPVESARDFVAAQAQMIAREALGCATSTPL